MDVRQDSPGPTYVRPSRRVDTRSTYRGWLLHRGVSRQVPLGLNATLTPLFKPDSFYSREALACAKRGTPFSVRERTA